jgi:hypothetical protein
LSYYALIVSAGDQKKYYDRGFEEINLALAAHVSKLTAADYKAVRPTIPFILGMVGEVKYEDDVIAEALENIQSAERASGIEPVALEDPNQGDPNEASWLFCRR